MIETVYCLYVVDPIGEGVTESWKVVGDTGETYLVKFNMYPEKTAINELICYKIAQYFELPVFKPVIIILDQDQCTEINKKRKIPVGPGKHFGVELIQPFYTVQNYEETFGVKLVKEIISNLHKTPDIFGFDIYVQNHDRHCMNVCILQNQIVKENYDYYLFDHSHAFGGPNWFAAILKELYKQFSKLHQFCLIIDNIKKIDQFDRFFRLLDKFRNDVDQVFEDLPPEWTKNLDTDMAELKLSLANTHKDKIIESIKNSKDLLKNLR